MWCTGVPGAVVVVFAATAAVVAVVVVAAVVVARAGILPFDVEVPIVGVLDARRAVAEAAVAPPLLGGTTITDAVRARLAVLNSVSVLAISR